MEGYKKSIQKEQEQNEKLTLILAKTERDIDSVKKQLTQCHARFDALKAEYTTYTRMLHETEQALNRATAVSCFTCCMLNGLYVVLGLGECVGRRGREEESSFVLGFYCLYLVPCSCLDEGTVCHNSLLLCLPLFSASAVDLHRVLGKAGGMGIV